MPKKAEASQAVGIQAEFDRLLEEALNQPGVAEVAAVFNRVYPIEAQLEHMMAATTARPKATNSNSTQ
ncbi:MAG TPA: hypothetical protein VGB42_04005 [Candidatus Thermoplasmatota archaeon]